MTILNKQFDGFPVHTLDPITSSYLAGFIDGGGCCILAQIVKRDDYRYKFQIRISVLFHQKTQRN